MSYVIWLLTAFLVLDCLILMLLVLIQLPKKEAGIGQAFGSGTTDALFGPGSGNVLTKLTKYTTVIFFAATALISVLQRHQAGASLGDPRANLTPQDLAASPAKLPAQTNAAAAGTETNNVLTFTNLNALKTNLLNNATGAVPPAATPPKL